MERYAPASTSASASPSAEPAPPALLDRSISLLSDARQLRASTRALRAEVRTHSDNVRRARLIEIQASQLASGTVPRSCRDLGRISPEAILHAAWLIQCRQAEEV